MKSVVIIIPNLVMGGAERWVANLSRLLCEQGCQVDLIVLEDRIEQELDSRVRMTILDAEKGISGSFLRRLWYAAKLRRVVSGQGRPDLIISTLPYADQVTSLARLKPVCFRIANTLSREIAGLGPGKGRRRHRRYKRIYGGQKLIAVSAGVKKDLVETFGFRDSDIATIYNPIDTGFLEAKAGEKEEDLPKEPYLLHSGRFARQKRHDVLLDAWRMMSRDLDEKYGIQKLVLLTDHHTDLVQMIRERQLEDSVIIAGTRKNPYPWVKGAECLLLSSEREGMPNVLLEALALGTPVASTDCPSGPRELLGERHPRALAELNDPTSLAEAVRYALGADFGDCDAILKPFQPSAVTEAILALGVL